MPAVWRLKWRVERPRIESGWVVMGRSQTAADLSLRGDRWQWSWRIALIIGMGFSAVAAFTYQNTLEAARRQVIHSTLPETLDSLSSDLEEDLVRPIVMASAMAANTLLIDWQAAGERQTDQVTRHLTLMQTRHGASTAFFVSARTGRYYHPSGVIKTVSPGSAQDSWFFRLRSLPGPYEVNLDRDTADLSRYTVFVNYKLLSEQGEFLGALGLGRSTTQLSERIGMAEQIHGIQVLFLDREGRILLSTRKRPDQVTTLTGLPELKPFRKQILQRTSDACSSWQDGRALFVRSKRIPELNWIVLVSMPLPQGGGALRGALAQISSIALLTLALALGLVYWITGQHHQKLEQLAFTDSLTGTLNRSAFPGLFRNLEQSARQNTMPLTVALLDIDHFKAINDRFGHQVGDGVIQAVARQIKEGCRRHDLLFRWGGEEFLLLLPDLDLGEAQSLLARLLPSIADRTMDPCLEGLSVTLSVGLTLWSPDDNHQSLIGRADEALYQAKRGGRNQVVSI